jgi:hypothetical protein
MGKFKTWKDFITEKKLVEDMSMQNNGQNQTLVDKVIKNPNLLTIAANPNKKPINPMDAVKAAQLAKKTKLDLTHGVELKTAASAAQEDD